MENKINKNYYICPYEYFPEIEDGQILYDSKKNNLYIDINGQRVLVNERFNLNQNNVNDALYWHSPQKTYGVMWNYNNSSPKLTRIGDASGFDDPVPATSLSEIGSSPFDNIYPWSEMKEVNILSDGTILNKEDNGFSYNNDTMVYIPEFYYKAEKDEIAKTHTWSISKDQIEGYKLHPGSGKYIGRYHISGSNELYSKTGELPTVLQSRRNFIIYSKQKGSKWRIIDISVWSALQMLYLVEFADWNSLDVLGKGWNVGDIGESGETDSAMYHTVKASGAHNQYRYVEDAFSNVGNFVDGFAINKRVGYISTASDNHIENTVLNVISTGITIPSTGIISQFACNDKCDFMFLPIKCTNSSISKYVCDKITAPTATYTNDLFLYVGGDYRGNIDYGFFGCRFKTNMDGDSYIGSRLMYNPNL